MSQCPGYNTHVLPQVAIGLGLAGGRTEAEATRRAEQEAVGKAMNGAMAQFANHMCPSPCVSVPIPRLLASGASVIGEISGGGHPDAFSAYGWAKAQLDVLCMKFDVPQVPPETPPPVSETVPGDIAPVTGGSRTTR